MIYAALQKRYNESRMFNASVTKRGNSYRIKVSCGYYSSGRQLIKTKTFYDDTLIIIDRITKLLKTRKEMVTHFLDLIEKIEDENLLKWDMTVDAIVNVIPKTKEKSQGPQP